jgi:hypothetical protein
MPKLPPRINGQIRLNDLPNWLNGIYDYCASLKPSGGKNVTVNHQPGGVTYSHVDYSGTSNASNNNNVDNYPFKIGAKFDDDGTYNGRCEITWKNTDGEGNYIPRFNLVILGPKWYDFQSSEGYETSVIVDSTGWIFLMVEYDIEEDDYTLTLDHDGIEDWGTDENVMRYPIAYTEIVYDDNGNIMPKIHQHHRGGAIVLPARIF